MTNIIVTIH